MPGGLTVSGTAQSLAGTIYGRDYNGIWSFYIYMIYPELHAPHTSGPKLKTRELNPRRFLFIRYITHT